MHSCPFFFIFIFYFFFRFVFLIDSFFWFNYFLMRFFFLCEHRYSFHGPLVRIVLVGRAVFIFYQGFLQNGENISGLLARMLSPHLFMRPLPSSLGQSRRTHFQGKIPISFCFQHLQDTVVNDLLLTFTHAVVSRQSRTSLSLQFCVSPIESSLYKDTGGGRGGKNMQKLFLVFIFIFKTFLAYLL